MIDEKNQIQMFLHCKQCMDELPQGGFHQEKMLGLK